MLLRRIALVNFALALEAQKTGVHQDDPASGRPHLARRHCRRHASHRVAQQNRGGKPELLDEPRHVARVI